MANPTSGITRILRGHTIRPFRSGKVWNVSVRFADDNGCSVQYCRRDTAEDAMEVGVGIIVEYEDFWAKHPGGES